MLPIFYRLFCSRRVVATQPIEEEFEDTKGRQSESVYQRRTDNIMAKRKSTKEQTTINKHTHKTKDQVTRTSLEIGSKCGDLILIRLY